MDKIEFIDQTIRDAQQSLWGNLMRTEYIVPIAEMMDKVGYRAIATVGSQTFTVQVRNLNEDPWERIRLLSKLITKTAIRGSYAIGSLSSFDLSTPRDIISLWIKRSVAHGIKSFWICDYQADMEKFIYFARIAKAEGAEVVPSLMYTTSPVHDMVHWARKVRLLADAKDVVDRIMIEDASGIITPEGTKELISTVMKNCDGLPLEFHSHCSTGLAPQCYVEAMKAGVTTLHTAAWPLANGTSLPSIEGIVKNARRLGFSTNLNDDALAHVSEHFKKIAEKERFPIGAPVEYDIFQFSHQVPGGMLTNLTRQLKEIRMEKRLDEILEEVVHVRKDLGYPVMATPYSQIVGAQAVENVLSGERYKHITDEVVKYALGYYEQPAAPVDQNLMDRITDSPQGKKLKDWKPAGYDQSVEELREKLGQRLSDDELLLKVCIPGKPAKPAQSSGKQPPPAETQPVPGVTPTHSPMEFNVDVDGEMFRIRISPSGKTPTIAETDGEETNLKRPREIVPGSVPCGMAGLVLSFNVKVGDTISAGDLLAVIEAMKMRRNISSPYGGVVKDICAQEGEMVSPEDILMVVA